jgi:hypothetical protein
MLTGRGKVEDIATDLNLIGGPVLGDRPTQHFRFSNGFVLAPLDVAVPMRIDTNVNIGIIDLALAAVGGTKPHSLEVLHCDGK